MVQDDSIPNLQICIDFGVGCYSYPLVLEHFSQLRVTRYGRDTTHTSQVSNLTQTDTVDTLLLKYLVLLTSHIEMVVNLHQQQFSL